MIYYRIDPEGLIFYKNPQDFNLTGNFQYKVTKNKESPPSIRVDFFKPGIDGINDITATPFSSVRFCRLLQLLRLIMLLNSLSPRTLYDSYDNSVYSQCSHLLCLQTDFTPEQIATYVQSGVGQWKDQQTGTSNGTLSKPYGSSTTATLKLEPIGKKITWTITEATSCGMSC